MKTQMTIGERLGRAYGDFTHHLELLTFIPIIEGIMRVWHHLNPRVYSARLRIKGVTEGKVASKGKKYIIFALYLRSELPPFIRNLLNAVSKSGFNLVIVSSGALSPQVRDELLANSHLLIERVNLGRDFGGYKDAIAILNERVPDIERLVIMNDSLYFFERGLDGIIEKLDSPHDFVGLTEVFQYHYHVQSFMLSFSAEVLRNKRFIKFWKKYRPITTRRWSVHKGEVGLTRAVTKAGFKPYILFHGAQLTEIFRGRPLSELLVAISLLPTFYRDKIYKKLEEIQLDQQAKPAVPFAALSDAMKGMKTVSEDPGMADLREARVRWLRNVSERTMTMDNWALDAVWREIVSTIVARNQIHAGGFLFMQYLGLPIIKRDILYRTVYAVEDIYEILTKFEEPLRDEVIADLRRTGTVAHFGMLQRLLFRHGSI